MSDFERLFIERVKGIAHAGPHDTIVIRVDPRTDDADVDEMCRSLAEIREQHSDAPHFAVIRAEEIVIQRARSDSVD